MGEWSGGETGQVSVVEGRGCTRGEGGSGGGGMEEKGEG